MKIGVFVGSFNPVHKGHIKIVNHLLNNNIVDNMLIIPTNGYWNKTNLIDLDKRIEMLKFYQSDKIIIDEKHNNLEYTYQVLRALKEEYKNDELYLLIGADNIVNFDKWVNYKELLNYWLIIYKRDNIDINSYLEKLGKKDKVCTINDVNNIDISSTLIRKNIRNKELLSKYLDNNVIKYIYDNNLYML